MKYLAYMNILFGDNHVQTVEIGKRKKKGGMPWGTVSYHPGIKNLI